MGSSRRAAGRRGCRPVGVSSSLGSHVDRVVSRQLRNISRSSSSTTNGQAAVFTVPPDLEDYYLSGRPMPDLFGCQDLRKFYSSFSNLLFLISFSGIIFTCANEAFGTSTSQWIEMARNTFLVYAGGHYVASRPRASLENSVLTVPFDDRAEFLDFLFQARQMNPTSLIEFTVEVREPRRVVCRALYNRTPILRVRGDEENLPPAANDDDLVVIHL